jgi:hypothetical protein
MLRNSSAWSVIGRAGSSSGVPADISAGTDGHVLRRLSGALGFGTITGSVVGGYTAGYMPFADGSGLLTPNTSAPFWKVSGLSLGINTTDPSAALDVRSTSGYSIFSVGSVTLAVNLQTLASAPTSSEVTATRAQVASGPTDASSCGFVNIGSGSFTENGTDPQAYAYSYKTINSVLYKTIAGAAVNAGFDTGLGSYDVSVSVATVPASCDGIVIVLNMNGTFYYQDFPGATSPQSATFSSFDSQSDPYVSAALAIQSTGAARNYRARAVVIAPSGSQYFGPFYDYTVSSTSGEFFIVEHRVLGFPSAGGGTVSSISIYGENSGGTSFSNTLSGDGDEYADAWGSGAFSGSNTQSPTTYGITGTGQTVRYRVRAYQNLRGYSDLYANSFTQSNNVTIPNTGSKYYISANYVTAPTYSTPNSAVNAWKYYVEKSSNNGASYLQWKQFDTSVGFGTGVIDFEDFGTAYTTGSYSATPTSFIPGSASLQSSAGNVDPLLSSAGYDLQAIYQSVSSSNYAGFEIRNGSNRAFALYGLGSNGYLAIGGTLSFRTVTSQVSFLTLSPTQITFGTSTNPQLLVAPSSVFTSGLLYVNGSNHKVSVGTTSGAGTFTVSGHSSSSQIAASIVQGSGTTGNVLQLVASSNATAVSFDSDFKHKTRRGKTAVGNYYAVVGGLTSQNTTQAGNIGTGEDTLMSYTTQAAELGTNGDVVSFYSGGAFGADATATKRLKVKFQGSIIYDSGAIAVLVATPWSISGEVIRVSSTSVRYAVRMSAGNMALAFTYASNGLLTGLSSIDSNSSILLFTGECSASINDQVTQTSLVTYWYGAP